MASLPFLVVHGGWIWPTVGAVVVGIAGLGAWRYARPRPLDGDDARLGPPPTNRVKLPLIAMAAAAALYYGACSTVGSLCLDQSEKAAAADWSSDPPAFARLAIAAASPKRTKALERVYQALAPTTLRAGVLEMRMDVLRLLGGHCERIVEQLSVLSNDEEALEQARRCTESPELLAEQVQSHLALGQLDAAAVALEREVQLAERQWTAEDAQILAMARHWASLEQAATSLAASTATAEPAPPRAILGLPDTIPAASTAGAVSDAWSCVGLAARYRSGDAAALEALRSRPLIGGGGACRMLAADATGAIEDLRALTNYPLEAAHLRGASETVTARGDLSERLLLHIDEAVGRTERVTPPYTVVPLERPDEFWDHLRGPDEWWDSGYPHWFNDLRQMVLATHAPGADVPYYVGGAPIAGFNLLQLPTPPNDLLGLRVRATLAMLPRRAQSAEAGRFVAENLPFVAMTMSNAARHAEAAAYLEISIDLQRSLPVQRGYPQESALQNLTEAAIATTLRAGALDRAIALFDAIQRSESPDGLDIVREWELGINKYVEIARGGLPSEERLARAFGGDGQALSTMTFDDWLDYRKQGLPLIAQRVTRGKEPLADLLHNYPRHEPGSTVWLEQLGHRLHLAESIGDVEAAAQLRTLVDIHLDAIVSDDTALLVALVSTLEYAN